MALAQRKTALPVEPDARPRPKLTLAPPPSPAPGPLRFYLRVRTRFVVSVALSLAWAAVSIWISLDWIGDLGALVTLPVAIAIIFGIAVIPGHLNRALDRGELPPSVPRRHVQPCLPPGHRARLRGELHDRGTDDRRGAADEHADLLRDAHRQRIVFHQTGLRIRRNYTGFLCYMLLYAPIMSPVSFVGYVKELTGAQRRSK